MAFDSGWVPARWPARAGPPERLRGGPVNCLVVDWPGAEEQARAARQAGFAVVGDLATAPDTAAAAASAKAAGLDAVIGPPALAGDFVIPGAPVGELPREGAWPAAVIREGVWPAIRLGQRGNAEAGPTGVPWIDSNGWAARLVHATRPGKTVWLDFHPPADAVLRAEDWVRAAADAGAHGARWILPAESLEGAARDALLRAVAFFATHREWPAAAASPVALVSDCRGDNEFLAHEFLNLAARRHLTVRILERARAAALPWGGLTTLVYIDAQPPAGALLEKLLAAVRAGALLIAPDHCAPLLGGAPGGEAPQPGYRMIAVGKGRAAIPSTPWEDPYLLAVDVQMIMGRRHAPLRLWNGANVLPYPAGADGARPRVVHLVNYGSRGGEVTLGLPGRYRAAMFRSPEMPLPARLEPRPARLGVEFRLPPFGAYGAAVLEAV